jgi:hypothetical protein
MLAIVSSTLSKNTKNGKEEPDVTADHRNRGRGQLL